MSAPDAAVAAHARSVQLTPCAPLIVELSSYCTSGAALQSAAAAQAVTLPDFGRLARTREQLALCVRPGRWLLLRTPDTPPAEPWYQRLTPAPAAVELSSALNTFLLAGPAAREVLSRGCRLDLDPEGLATGHATATIMAQVAVTLAVLPAGVLLLTPASTAQHVREWLAEAARYFDFTPRAGVPFTDVCGERSL